MRKFFDGVKTGLRQKLRSERAENTITMMIAFPLLWAILMTILDFGIFMQDRTLLVSDLRDGARTVAIFGGTNNDGTNALIKAYGTTCGATPSDTIHSSGSGISNSAYGTDLVACLVKNQIVGNNGYAQIVISNIKCGVSDPSDPKNPKTSGSVKIGQAVSCAAHYKYEGFPGSALGLLGGDFMMSGQASGSDGSIQNANAEITQSGWNEGDVVVSAQSEVTMN